MARRAGEDVPVHIAQRVEALLGAKVSGITEMGRAPTGQRWRARLASEQDVFVKGRAGAPDGFFAAEAAGLRWLAEAPGGPPVPPVLAYDSDTLVLPWLAAGRPTPAGAARLGRELAALHASGAPAFGAGWAGWIGAAELDNRGAGDWPTFYAERRLAPYVRQLVDGHRFSPSDAAVFDRLASRLPRLAGPPEPPARIHGDLWSGNVLWAADGRAWLVDPAAHGGHRETDLAMLELFGAPSLERLIGGYQEVRALADGWRDRVELHQLHPLLVHAVLFDGGYGEQSIGIARRYAGGVRSVGTPPG